jgi:TonB-dependent starch-binding outer membrane protein SusC
MRKKQKAIYLQNWRCYNKFIIIAICFVLFQQNVNAQTKVIETKNAITGIIVDEKGTPLIGASVLVKGKQIGTVSDSDGRFRLEIPMEDDVLTISYIGYKNMDVLVSNRILNRIVLKEDEKFLDEVVVIGYGTVKKSDLTGSVSVVKTQDIQDIPVMRVDQALQGRMAGVDVMSVDGEPGSGTSIRVRGTRSITASNEPLYVIDGVVGGISNLSDINPSDINSIQVLKDASSTAIYGSRAANGVVLITTKEGKEGKNSFVFRADGGIAQLPSYLDLMNASEYAVFYNDYKSLPVNILSTNTSGAPTGVLENLPYTDPFSLGEGTNWTKEVTRIAPYKNYTLSGSGGSKTFQYYFSGSYNNTEGIVKNTGMERILGHLNLTQTISQFVKAGLRINFSRSLQNRRSIAIGGLSSSAVMSLPPTMNVYKPDGSYNDWNPILGGKGGYVDSPVAMVDLEQNSKLIKSFATNFFLEIRPIKNMVIKSILSYQDYKTNENKLLPSTLPTRNLRGQGAYASQIIYGGEDLLNENTVTYQSKKKKHIFDFLYGATYQQKIYNTLSVQGYGYTNDQISLYDMGGVPSKENLTVGSSYVKSVMVSNLARMNYNYNEKYYLTITGRADGSSNFAEGNKWAFFPSVAIKWNINKEKFMRSLSHISELSLRASVGLTGNQAISPYSSLGQIVSYSNGYIFDNVIPGSAYLLQVSNNNLTWEKTTSSNVGMDFSILKKRIVFTLDAYITNTKDLLLNVQLPTQTGFNSRLENIGRTSNKGIELTIDSRNISKKNFSWSTVLTLSNNKQMVIDAGGYDRIPTYTPNPQFTYEMYGFKQGFPVNALWGMVYAGTWKSKEEITENTTTRKYVSKTQGFTDLGWPKYVDQNNDGILDRLDIVYLGSSDPFIYGGLQNNFRIYGFQVKLYFNYSLGGKIFNPIELSMGSGDYQTSQYRYMVNAWHPVRNPLSDIPRANSKDFVVSTRQLHDASYLRLKDVSISYAFELAKITRKRLDKLTLTASGSNVYLWKYYNGFDPEVSSPNATRRVDLGAYPKSRTFVLSAQLNF